MAASLPWIADGSILPQVLGTLDLAAVSIKHTHSLLVPLSLQPPTPPGSPRLDSAWDDPESLLSTGSEGEMPRLAKERAEGFFSQGVWS